MRDSATGKSARIHYTSSSTTLGPILVAKSAAGICAILFGEDSAALLTDLQARFPHSECLATSADADLAASLAQVIRCVEQPSAGLILALDLDLSPRGTAFQRRVWQALREIPLGSTLSYSQVAAKIGSPKAVRAVASACAANALGIAIPCHRVVRADGGLAGFRWGISRKTALLAREAAA